MTVNSPDSYVEVTIRPGLSSHAEGAVKRAAKGMLNMSTSFGSVIVIKQCTCCNCTEDLKEIPAFVVEYTGTGHKSTTVNFYRCDVCRRHSLVYHESKNPGFLWGLLNVFTLGILNSLGAKSTAGQAKAMDEARAHMKETCTGVVDSVKFLSTQDGEYLFVFTNHEFANDFSNANNGGPVQPLSPRSRKLLLQP